MAKDFRHINPASAKVMILEGSPSVLAAYPPDLQLKAVEQLKDLGVSVRTGARVTDIQPGYVVIGGTEKVESAVTLWAAGVQASPLGKMLGTPVDKRGCVIVDQFLNPPEHPEIFVCGDLAHVEEDGHQVPGVAQPAMQMGKYAATRIGRLISLERGSDGSGLNAPFHYFDKGDMATIGRKAAVANIKWPFKGHLSGLFAWLTWLFVHVFFLIGFRNRIAVFRQWAWTYISFSDGARLITGSQELAGWDSKYMQQQAGTPAVDPVQEPVAKS
jgi:NADH dehydrogenase